METCGGPPKPHYVTEKALSDFITAAIREDVGEGDYTTLAAVPESRVGSAHLIVKDNGMIAGICLAEAIYKHFDSRVKFRNTKSDGDKVRPGETPFFVEGPVRSILTTERIILNCMQRMSGIATYANRLVKLLEGTRARLMDTRKTTPGFRLLEKWAVHIGGGVNHRFALYDMVMLKDNHVDMAGGPRQAIEGALNYLRSLAKPLDIEIETRTIDEVKQVMQVGGIKVIMLDNMSLDEMKQAVGIIGGQYKTEASGRITESTIRSVAECGVDYISVGALTHSAPSLDLSLKIIK